jgi:hypothetical protein
MSTMPSVGATGPPLTPPPAPFALPHADTGHNSPEATEYRDPTVAGNGLRPHATWVQHS